MAKLSDLILTGATGARPAAGIEGRLFYDTTTHVMYRDNGATWDNVEGVAGGAGSDTTAIHDNVASEISAITEKATPVDADMILIEDSEDSNAKKMVQVGNLPGGTGPGGGADVLQVQIFS